MNLRVDVLIDVLYIFNITLHKFTETLSLAVKGGIHIFKEYLCSKIISKDVLMSRVSEIFNSNIK